MGEMPEHSPDVRVDVDRERRIGLPEAVLCSHKSPTQIADAVDRTLRATGRVLCTRLDADRHAELPARIRELLDFDPVSRTAIHPSADEGLVERVAIVAAGTSDVPVAREVERTLAFHGVGSRVFVDVGVAGLWRVLEIRAELARFEVVIAVAGMEGALFAVLGGLVGGPLIAVPTSVGYGVTEQGRAALATALGSCAPGVVAVNIDNGYGAATAAIRALGVRPT